MKALRAVAASAPSQWHSVLPRGVLCVEGRDARKLLQGLVTNDVDAIDAGPLYAAFLTAQGRVLFDAFMVAGRAGSVLLDVERASLPSLAKYVQRYKLRSKAQIRDVSDDFSVLAASSDVAAPTGGTTVPSEGGAWADPRLPVLGHRILHPRDAPLPAWLSGSAEVSSELYSLQLALLGVPGGEEQMRREEALPLESNLDLLHGISFAKGCYLGQELTARTHFRGVVRKRLVPVVDGALPPSDSPPVVGGGACPALAHLPPAVQWVAATLLDPARPADEAYAELMAQRAHAATDGGSPSSERALGTRTRGDVSLLDAAGSKAGSLRSYDPQLGLGMALCRLDALGGEEPLRLELAEGGGQSEVSVRPLRPTWWPEDP